MEENQVMNAWTAVPNEETDEKDQEEELQDYPEPTDKTGSLLEASVT